jgi:Xaa-Pro aminopeptidase
MNKNLELLKQTGVDAAIIFSGENLFYFSKYENNEAALIITKEKSYYYTDNRYIEEAEKAVINAEIHETDRYNKTETILNILKKYKKIGFEGNITYSDFNKYLNPLQGKEFKDISEDIYFIRSIKTQEELDKIAVATKITEKSLKELIPLFKQGVTEKDLANELDYRFIKNGADCTGFKTIIAFQSSASVPHHIVSDKKLNSGDVILIDCGAKYNGYTSDITRTFIFGSVDAEIKNVYNIILKANKLGLDMLKEGIRCGEVDKAVRDYIADNGYGDKFLHSLGHGVGVEVHEYPSLRKDSIDVLKSNMVVTIEPGVYINNYFGIRIEDICYINGNKASVFSSLEKDFNVI